MLELAAIASFVGYLAGSVHLAGYVQYNRVMIKDPDHDPNAASWFMWAIGAGIEVFLYHELVQDPAKEFLPKICALGMLFTFAHAWQRHGLRLKWSDWKEISADIAAVMIWLTAGTVIANIFMGVDVWISFRPIMRDVRENPKSEVPGPWATWSVAYALMTMAVLLNWKNWYELVFPVVSFLVHFTVWRYSFFGSRKPL